MERVPEVITARWLLKHGASRTCGDFKAFKREWPDGIKPLRRSWLKVARLKLPVTWLAIKLLPAACGAAFKKAGSAAWRPCQRACDAAPLARFWSVTAPAWAEYRRARALALLEQWRAALKAQKEVAL